MVSAEPALIHCCMMSTVWGSWKNVTEGPSTGMGRDWGRRSVPSSVGWEGLLLNANTF